MSSEKRPKSSGALGSLRDKYNNWRQKRDASLDFSSPEGSQKSKNSSKNGSYTTNPSQASGQTYHDNNNHMNQASAFNSNIDTNNSPQMAPRRVPQNTDQKKKLQTLTSLDQKSQDPNNRHPSCQFQSEKRWLELQYNETTNQIMKPNELEDYMKQPPDSINEDLLYRIQGSIIGMALGDALGAHVEFRPRQYLLDNPVKGLVGGGTWGLAKGQFTDDTSMALCLANSLVTRKDFCPYDQLVRYKWWYQLGYMSSTGECFDIGNATRQSIDEFHRRQKRIVQKKSIPIEDIDFLSDPCIIEKFKIYCSEDGVAGNGALMRLAPVPLFFFRHPTIAVEYSGISGQITHGDVKAYDACRYYGALIVAALKRYSKDDLLDKNFYSKHRPWFGDKPLCSDIQKIAEGSYQKKGGYKDGIRGKGYIVAALEAALWAFWSDGDSFEIGALNAVNLGDDTDTTAAIYGQLAGAYYGYENLPKKWLKHVYAHNFMLNLSEWIAYEGKNWKPSGNASLSIEGAPIDTATNGSYNPIVTDLLQHEPSDRTQKPTRLNNDVGKYAQHEPHEASTSPTQTTLDRNISKHPQMTNCNNDEINSTYEANASASTAEPIGTTKKRGKSGREHKN